MGWLWFSVLVDNPMQELFDAFGVAGEAVVVVDAAFIAEVFEVGGCYTDVGQIIFEHIALYYRNNWVIGAVVDLNTG